MSLPKKGAYNFYIICLCCLDIFTKIIAFTQLSISFMLLFNLSAFIRNFSTLLKPKNVKPQQQPHQQDLSKVMKVELIQDKEPDEIKSIWEQYHIQKEHVIAATLPSKDFDQLTETARKYPLFLFALPRSQGYEFFMCQFEGNVVHFTPLLYYQVSIYLQFLQL